MRLTRMKKRDPVHPGELLIECYMRPRGVTQVSLATTLGWTGARLNELVNGKRGVTAESALDLADALKTPAGMWMNLQSAFDLARARKRRERRGR